LVELWCHHIEENHWLVKDKAATGTSLSRISNVAVAKAFELGFLVLTFATGAVLRTFRLQSVPTGLRLDEAYNGVDVLRILAGERPVFLTANFGREALFIYAQALSVSVLGRTDLAMRAAATAFGMMTGAGFTATLARDVARNLGMFNIAGDPNWDRNIPARPIFDPLSSCLMAMGLVLACRRWRSPSHALLLLWIALMLMPGFFFAYDAPNFLHFTGLIPAIFVLPAIGAEWLWARWDQLTQHRLLYVPCLVALCAYGAGAVSTYRDYFGTWAHSAEVSFLFDSDRWLTLDVARHLALTQPAIVVVGAGDRGSPLARFALRDYRKTL
jgi:hypothetical protein